MAVSLEAIAIIVAVAFLPPILFAISIARSKRYRREPGGALMAAFIWGATGAAFLALVVNTVASGTVVRPYLRHDGLTQLAVVLIVAPLVEETVKPLVLYMGRVKRNTDEAVDGIIYGAIAGLGFSATENLLYEVAALIETGIGGWVLTAIARTFSSSLLHATATAITGYGIARYLTGKSTVFGVIPYFLGAVLLHSAFNGLASINLGFGVILLIVLAVYAFGRVKRRIHELSLVAPHGTWHRVGRHKVIEPDQTSRTEGTAPEHWTPVRRGGPPPDDAGRRGAGREWDPGRERRRER